VKKKSTIKVENIEIEDPTKELEIKEDGGKKPKKITIKRIINKAKNFPNPGLFRIAIDEINEDTKEIIERLWDWGCVFIVATEDLEYLNKVNFEYMNRSYSIGRYYYVDNQAEIYRQPCDLLVLCKEIYDSSNSFNFAQETINYYEN
jgi:hypothetical protein